jgi:DNA-binding phage protein
MVLMTTGFDEFDSRIHDLVEREKECDDLFKEIKNGNGENSLRYLALRDACKELRKGIFRSAKSTGLTRESIKMKIKEVRNEKIATNAKQTRKNQQNQPTSRNSQ